MLQRIQTVYLLIAMLLSWLVSFLTPFCVDQEGQVVFLSFILRNGETVLMMVPLLFIISGSLSLASFFSFKNRNRQIVFNRMNIIFNFLLLGIIVYHLLMLPGETLVSEKGIGVFIPVLVVVLLALANKAIIKDERLVKSVDRLR